MSLSSLSLFPEPDRISMGSGFVLKVLMLATISPFYDILLAGCGLFLLSFFRERILVRFLEIPLHVFLVYRLFFSSFIMAKTSLAFVFLVSILLFLLLWTFCRTRFLFAFSCIPILTLLLSRILPSVPMADFAVYLGSFAPQAIAATGLISDQALPGLSYLAFRWIRATVDLQQTQTKPRFTAFLSYSFFAPWYGSGPISSFSEYERGQLGEWHRTLAVYKTAVLRIIWGATKFYVLSSIVFQVTFTRLLMDSIRWNWGLFIIAALAYSAYLFLNFSGFTDMMIGLSALLGHKSTENFDRPYLATSLKQFWRTWHISLTSLLKDFIYIPIVKKLNAWGIDSRALTYPLGTGVVFIAMPLWHGSRWNFMAFSGLQVLALSLEDFWSRKAIPGSHSAKPTRPTLEKWFRRCLLWLFLALSFFFFENSPEQLVRIKNLILASRVP